MRALWPMHTATHAYSEPFATARACRCPNEGGSSRMRKCFLVSSLPLPLPPPSSGRVCGRKEMQYPRFCLCRWPYPAACAACDCSLRPEVWPAQRCRRRPAAIGLARGSSCRSCPLLPAWPMVAGPPLQPAVAARPAYLRSRVWIQCIAILAANRSKNRQG